MQLVMFFFFNFSFYLHNFAFNELRHFVSFVLFNVLNVLYKTLEYGDLFIVLSQLVYHNLQFLL